MKKMMNLSHLMMNCLDQKDHLHMLVFSWCRKTVQSQKKMTHHCHCDQFWKQRSVVAAGFVVGSAVGPVVAAAAVVVDFAAGLASAVAFFGLFSGSDFSLFAEIRDCI